MYLQTAKFPIYYNLDSGRAQEAIPRRPSPDVMGAAEGGCCTPGALCVVASCTSFASGQARSLSRFAAPPSPCKGKPLHGNPCSKKASQTPKGKPLATVSHDPATTLPGTVSHRAERISNCESIARLRRPCQKQAPNLQAAQPSCTHHPSAVREASPRSAMHKYPLTKLPLPVC